MTTSPSPPAALGPLPFWTSFEAPGSGPAGAEDPAGSRRRGPKVPRQVLVSADRAGAGGEGRIGTVFAGDWEIKRRLGAGGMGEVFEALNRRDRRRYALKILAGAHAGRAGIVERFRHEFLALSRVQHAGVVRVFGSGCWEGEEWYSMELLRGTSLEERCKAGPLAGSEVVEIGIELCEALEALHAEAVIHRDLKPANVIVLAEPEGGRRVKLLDLGVAKLMPAFYAEGEAVTPPEGRIQTQAGMPLGTPGYMAPEVFMGASAAEGQDVFGLGVTLFRAATGRMPFTAARVGIEEAPRWSHELGRSMPVALEIVLRRALAVDPEARFRSMAEFRDELERVREEMEAENGVIRGEPRGSGEAQRRDATAPAAASEHRRGLGGLTVFFLGLVCGVALTLGVGRWRETEEAAEGPRAARVNQPSTPAAVADGVGPAPGSVNSAMREEPRPPGMPVAAAGAPGDTSATEDAGANEETRGEPPINQREEEAPTPTRSRSSRKVSTEREAAIAGWLAEHRGRVAGCLRSSSGAAAAVLVVEVNPAGEITEVALEGGSWPSMAVGCVRRALRGLKAPTSSGSTVHRLRLGSVGADAQGE